MPDPTLAYHATTSAAPEWAAAVTVGVPRMLAEIERLRAANDELNIVVFHLTQIEREGHAEASRRLQDLMDVKAECCRLTDRNGDLEAENKRLKAEAAENKETILNLGSKLESSHYKAMDADQRLIRADAIEEASSRLVRGVQSYTPHVNPTRATVMLVDYDAVRAALAMPSGKEAQ